MPGISLGGILRGEDESLRKLILLLADQRMM
jgi:hypothetical protein